MSEIRFVLPDRGPVTGTLFFRQPTEDEEFAFCDEKAKPRASMTRARVRYVNLLMMGCDGLRVHGEAIDPTDPTWKSKIPVAFKEAICLKTFEAAALFSQDDEKNSDGPSD